METAYYSDPVKVFAGVPQGSVLGPLLFLVMINNFPRATSNEMFLFADDSTLICNNKNKNHLEKDMNDALHDIINWLNSNNLIINLNKTKVMTFKNRVCLTEQLCIKFDNQIINEIDVTKFLGVYIDSQMSWKPHIEAVCSKLNQFSYALHMLSKVTVCSTVLIAYHSYVVSCLRYGVIFWGNSVNVQSVFVAQKRCIRSIFKLKKLESCKPFFINYRLFTLPCLYIFETVVFVKANINLFQNLKTNRCNSNLSALPHKTAMFSKNISGMATKIFNKLPDRIKRMDDINLFKREVKNFLYNKAYYCTNEYLSDILNF